MSAHDILELQEDGSLLLNKQWANENVEDWYNGFTLSGLAECGPTCAFCGHPMVLAHDDQVPNEDILFNLTLRYCRNCRNWVWNCLDIYSLEANQVSEGCPPVPKEATAWSKLADFSPTLPEGAYQEMAQALRQNPKRWHKVAPTVLERFLAAAFRASGEYCDVTHVGRPGDGGVDIVLVEGESCRWLVSVKRREIASKVEPISTLRDILGAMVLDGSHYGIIATTAGRFSVPARLAKVTALQNGHRIELMDRFALDRLIGNLLPDDAWWESLSQFSQEAADRITRRLPSDRQLRIF